LSLILGAKIQKHHKLEGYRDLQDQQISARQGDKDPGTARKSIGPQTGTYRLGAKGLNIRKIEEKSGRK
jgi:hypothetical protein